MINILVILLLLFGCSNPLVTEIDKCIDCNADIFCDLPMTDGIYILDFNENYVQTFTQLRMETECGWSQHIQWDTDYQYRINTDWVSLVNPASMTDEDGSAKVMFGAWEPFIGYTVTVYCGYTDLCGVHHTDSIQITIVNEE